MAGNGRGPRCAEREPCGRPLYSRAPRCADSCSLWQRVGARPPVELRCGRGAVRMLCPCPQIRTGSPRPGLLRDALVRVARRTVVGSADHVVRASPVFARAAMRRLFPASAAEGTRRAPTLQGRRGGAGDQRGDAKRWLRTLCGYGLRGEALATTATGSERNLHGCNLARGEVEQYATAPRESGKRAHSGQPRFDVRRLWSPLIGVRAGCVARAFRCTLLVTATDRRRIGRLARCPGTPWRSGPRWGRGSA